MLPCSTYRTCRSRLTIAGSVPLEYFRILDVGGTTKPGSVPSNEINESAKPKDSDSPSCTGLRKVKGSTASDVSRVGECDAEPVRLSKSRLIRCKSVRMSAACW